MAVTLYRWDDPGAPVLTNQNYEVAEILKACLVTGYGSKAPAGWSKPFEDVGAQKLVLRQGGGLQRYYRFVDRADYGFNDTGRTRVRGYEAMTGVDTGTDPFPTVAQIGDDGTWWTRSSSQQPGPHQWMVLADQATAYWALKRAGESSWWLFMAGDVYSLKPNDSFRAALVGGRDPGNNLNYNPILSGSESMSKHIARDVSTVLKSLNWQTLGFTPHLDNGALFVGLMAYPSPVDGNLHLQRPYIFESPAVAVRGWLRGLYGYLHTAAGMADLSTFTGKAGTVLDGKTFLALSFGSGFAVLETSNTWDTN